MENSLVEKREHRGYTCKVYIDEDPTPPNDWDLLGKIYSNSRYYNPDDHKIEEILIEDGNGDLHVDPDYIYVKIWAYEHSGLTLSCSRVGNYADPWDSGLFGLMAVHKDKAAKEFGDLSNPENYERVIKCLEAEVSDWDLYYTGQVYGYVVEDEDECHVDSCWGFYGESDEVMEEAISIADCEADKRERAEREEAERVAKYEMICEPFWID